MPKAYNPHDRLMIRAKREGFRARSVYKLQEINNKFNLFVPGMKVLDLGAAPGSWLQFASQKVGSKGQILGLDLQEIEPVAENVITQVCDIQNSELVNQLISELGWAEVDLIVSDIAPSISGIKHADQLKSLELNRAVFEVAKKYLNSSGKLVIKVFQGEGLDRFFRELKNYFRKVEVMTARASRDRSVEQYVVCSIKKI